MANSGKLWQTLFLANSKKRYYFAKACQKFRLSFNICQKKTIFWQTLANFGKLRQTLLMANSKKKVIFCQSLPYLPPPPPPPPNNYQNFSLMSHFLIFHILTKTQKLGRIDRESCSCCLKCCATARKRRTKLYCDWNI